MTTTFHVTNFKNKTLDVFTGQSTQTPIGYVVPYNGTQPADPSVTPTGTAEFATIANAPNLSTKISSAAGGVAQLSASTAPTTPSGAAAVSSLTFARIYTTGQLPIIDTPVSTSGGGGGVILDSLTSSTGVGNNVNGFSIKMPNVLNTLMLSQSLANRLADVWGTTGVTAPAMGNTTNGASAITLYSGSAPASADAAATGTALATFNMTATNLWAAASAGSSGLNGTGPSVVASATGTVGYFRIVKTNGTSTFTVQGSVSTTSGGGDMILSTLSLTSGTTSVQITDLTISI